MATLNAVSREGEYLSCSIAMTVWRVAVLRRMQFKSTGAGNVTVQTFLGKQLLGQRDRTEQEPTGSVGVQLPTSQAGGIDGRTSTGHVGMASHNPSLIAVSAELERWETACAVHRRTGEVTENAGGLNRSMQHWLEVYWPGFESPRFF